MKLENKYLDIIIYILTAEKYPRRRAEDLLERLHPKER
jgi:hypothetical protein